jgi:hypothetical protein
MKNFLLKSINKIIFFSFVFVLFAPVLSFAQNSDDAPIKRGGFQIVPKCQGLVVGNQGPVQPKKIGTDSSGSAQYECTWGDLLNLGRRIMLFLIYFCFSLAILSFTWAGFLYVTAFGQMGKIEQAHQIFSKVVTGLILVFAGWLIVATILKTLGVDSAFSLVDFGGVKEFKQP